MKETIETRELIVLDGLDVIIRGTYHKAYDDCDRTQPQRIGRGSIGILFLNSPSPTRAAHGDSAVYWADSFAECGYPSFRLDLPGFGDSEENLSTEMLNFPNPKGCPSIASVKIRELVTRFDLEGVVIVDQCPSSVGTIYAAASSPECKGLVLMDPCLDLPQAIRSAIRQHPRDFTSQRCRRLSSAIYSSQTQPHFSPSGSNSPEIANCCPPLRSNEMALTGLPILIFRAPDRKAKLNEFDQFDYLVDLASRETQVVINVLDTAHHSFASQLGRMTVRRRTEAWLKTCFPLVPQKGRIRS
jgi:hypothetical protein